MEKNYNAGRADKLVIKFMDRVVPAVINASVKIILYVQWILSYPSTFVSIVSQKHSDKVIVQITEAH